MHKEYSGPVIKDLVEEYETSPGRSSRYNPAVPLPLFDTEELVRDFGKVFKVDRASSFSEHEENGYDRDRTETIYCTGPLGVSPRFRLFRHTIKGEGIEVLLENIHTAQEDTEKGTIRHKEGIKYTIRVSNGTTQCVPEVERILNQRYDSLLMQQRSYDDDWQRRKNRHSRA